MYKAYLSKGPNSVIFFLILVLLGKFIMLNLLLSIMLGHFEMSSTLVRIKIEDDILSEFEKSKKREMEK